MNSLCNLVSFDHRIFLWPLELSLSSEMEWRRKRRR